MQTRPRWSTLAAVFTVAIAASSVSSLGCNTNEEPYKPQPAYSGRKATLPAVPTLSSAPKKIGDAYTVFGAIHDLKSRIHSSEVSGKSIAITGYIVDANYASAPKCAQHKTGKKDPDGCASDIPAFWIADAKGDTKGQMIRVLGWAKNWATVFDAMDKYKNLKEPPKELVKDDVWGVDVPFPLPAVGAKVKITGRYGYTFSKASTGLVSDPQHGVITYEKLEYIEPPTEPAEFAKK